MDNRRLPRPPQAKNRSDVISTIERFTYRNPSSIEYARAIFSTASPEILSGFKKKELFDLLNKLAEKLNPVGAIYLYQDALSKSTNLGQRFRKQGPINKSDFTRGTIKNLYDILLVKQRSLKQEQDSLIRKNNSVNFYSYHMSIGYQQLNAKDHESAKNSFERAIIHDPHSAAAHFELGFLYSFHYKNHIAAVKAFEHAIWINPNCSTYYFACADALNLAVEYEKSMDYINEAIDLDKPTVNAQHYLLRADIHYNLNNFNEALADHHTVIEHEPNEFKGYLERGKFHEARENPSAAFRDYIKAAELYKAANPQLITIPTDCDIYHRLNTFLTDLIEEELKRLSKSDIIKMLTDITAFLNSDDALLLCEKIRDESSPLGARFAENEKFLGLFAISSEKEMQQLDALENSLRGWKRHFNFS